jgi:hypothetical protein
VGFLLRILFSGMIMFVPNADRTEVTVLLLNVDHNHHSSDGTVLGQHNPVLVARAGNCTGQCTKRDPTVAQALFSDKTQQQAEDALEAAVAGGGAWALAGSELSIEKGSSTAADLPALILRKNVRGTVNGEPALIPTSSVEREDYTWIADLRKICPTGCGLNPAIFSAQPPAGLIAARLKLRTGKVFTYAVARIGSDVTPVRFERLDGQGTASPYSQAVTTWAASDVEISGDSVEIVESSFTGGAGRSMKLEPDADGKVEVAVLNLPSFVPPATTSTATPGVGKHFEAFYELAANPPAVETRLVPKPGALPDATYPAVDWHSVHPTSAVSSDLLSSLRLEIGRSPNDKLVCPIIGDGPP